MSTAAWVEWEPGIPLYPRAQYSQYLFNFRDDPDTERCGCADAASWPEPAASRRIPDGDELGALIADVRAAEAAGLTS